MTKQGDAMVCGACGTILQAVNDTGEAGVEGEMGVRRSRFPAPALAKYAGPAAGAAVFFAAGFMASELIGGGDLFGFGARQTAPDLTLVERRAPASPAGVVYSVVGAEGDELVLDAASATGGRRHLLVRLQDGAGESSSARLVRLSPRGLVESQTERAELADASDAAIALDGDGALFVVARRPGAVSVQRLDPQGETDWTRDWPAQDGLSFVSAATVGDGVVAVGPGELEDAMVAARYDADGAMIWQRNFNIDRDRPFAAVDVAEDGGVFLALNAPAPGGGARGLVRRIDAAGQVDWLYEYELPPGASLTGLAALRGGASAVALSGVESWVSRLNAAGAIEWITPLPPEASGGPAQVAAGRNGGVFTLAPTQSGQASEFWLGGYSPDGALAGVATSQLDGRAQARAISVDGDGSAVVTGEIRSFAGGADLMVGRFDVSLFGGSALSVAPEPDPVAPPEPEPADPPPPDQRVVSSPDQDPPAIEPEPREPETVAVADVDPPEPEPEPDPVSEPEPEPTLDPEPPARAASPSSFAYACTFTCQTADDPVVAYPIKETIGGLSVGTPAEAATFLVIEHDRVCAASGGVAVDKPISCDPA